jgi:hypothetical protein
MMSDREHAIHDKYHAVALALELLAEMHGDEASRLCIECAQRCAWCLYENARSADIVEDRHEEPADIVEEVT